MQLRTIQSKIYEINGQKVMFDFDLSVMYEVETRSLSQIVISFLFKSGIVLLLLSHSPNKVLP